MLHLSLSEVCVAVSWILFLNATQTFKLKVLQFLHHFADIVS